MVPVDEAFSSFLVEFPGLELGESKDRDSQLPLRLSVSLQRDLFTLCSPLGENCLLGVSSGVLPSLLHPV